MEELEELLKNKLFKKLLEELAEAKKKYREAEESQNSRDKSFYYFKIVLLTTQIQHFLIQC